MLGKARIFHLVSHSFIYSITIGFPLHKSRANPSWHRLRTHPRPQAAPILTGESFTETSDYKTFCHLPLSYSNVIKRQCSVLFLHGELGRLRKGESWKMWPRRDPWVCGITTIQRRITARQAHHVYGGQWLLKIPGSEKCRWKDKEGQRVLLQCG